MTKKLKIAFFLILMPWMGSAQLIDNKEGVAFTDKPFFNQSFIKENGIKTISGRFIYFPLGKGVKETSYFHEYLFNESGQLIREELCDEKTENRGSFFIDYRYDDRNNLISIVNRDSYSLMGYFYKYDEDGRVIEKQIRENRSPIFEEDGSYKLLEEHTIFSQKYSYGLYDNQLHQTVYNEIDLPYKRIIMYYDDSLKNILEKTEQLERMKSIRSTLYDYDDKGNILEEKTLSKDFNTVDKSIVYCYDYYGRLEKKEEYTEGELKLVYDIIYKQNSELINDILIKDVPNNYIKIIELRSYTYFDGRERR